MSSETSTSNTTVTQNTKEKNSSKFWAWLLAIVLLVLAGLFVWDKIQSNNRYEQLKKEHQTVSEQFRKYQTENESMQNNYSDLMRKYDELNTQLGGNAAQLEASASKIAEYEAQLAAKNAEMAALQKSLQSAFVDFKSDELKVETRDGKLYVIMLDKLLFQSGSSDVQAKGKKAIQTLAKELGNNPNVGIMVEGHTDNVKVTGNKYKDNWELSTARANSVVRALSDAGLPQKRLASTGRAEYYPVASNATEAGRAQNRRTEIILTPFSVERVEAK